MPETHEPEHWPGVVGPLVVPLWQVDVPGHQPQPNDPEQLPQSPYCEHGSTVPQEAYHSLAVGPCAAHTLAPDEVLRLYHW